MSPPTAQNHCMAARSPEGVRNPHSETLNEQVHRGHVSHQVENGVKKKTAKNEEAF